MCLLPKGLDLYNISSFLSHPPQYLLWHSDAVHAPLNGKHDFFLYKSKSNYITFCLTTLVWLPYMMREAHSYSFLCSALPFSKSFNSSFSIFSLALNTTSFGLPFLEDFLSYSPWLISWPIGHSKWKLNLFRFKVDFHKWEKPYIWSSFVCFYHL